MELIFVLVLAVSSLVLLQDLVQTWSLDIGALSNHVFAVVEGLFMLLFFYRQLVVEIQLVYQSFTGASVEHIHNTGFDHFMETDRVVPAVVKNFDYLGIDHDVPQYLSG